MYSFPDYRWKSKNELMAELLKDQPQQRAAFLVSEHFELVIVGALVLLMIVLALIPA